MSRRRAPKLGFGMIRVVLLSLVTAGLMYAAYTSLLTDELDLPDSPTNRPGEPLQLARETPWTKIDLAAQNSRHAIIPEEDVSPTAAPEDLPSLIEAEKDPSIAHAQVTSAVEQTEQIRVTAPASIREGPSASAPIIGVAQPGAEAQVISREAEWVQLIDAASKRTGWIESSFLESNSQPESKALSKQEIEAALDTRDEVDSSAPEIIKPAMGPRKAQKHGSRHIHRKHRYAFRFLFRRAW